MSDVAKASGHSRSTVDRVLNGRASVRSDTAQQIQAAAQSLGYFAAGVLRERVREVRSKCNLGFLLQRPDSPFYVGLAEELQRATLGNTAIQGKPCVEYVKSQAPDQVAQHILDMGEHVDALAMVVADHPLVSEAIAVLAKRGIPTFALISDLSSPQRAGYVGLDNRQLGRTAAWFVTELAHSPGKVAMYVGSPRFQCQELSEISFRSYIREHAPDFTLLETISTLESEEYGEERTHDLVQHHPDLCGFYMGGSGIEGVLRAMRLHKSDHRIVGVGNELTKVTRSGLLSGHFHAILSHPLPLMCLELVGFMANSLATPTDVFRQIIVPIDITVQQNA
jgi:LacI family transcriptional regulator